MNRDDRTPKSPRKSNAISRRSFIKGAGAVAAAAGLVRVRQAEADEKTLPPGVVEKLGPEAATIELKINGKLVRLEIEPRVTLLAALRDYLGLYGTKLVCDRGACGACTVHLDGNPVTSCMILAVDARGHEIMTIEGLGGAGRMHPLQTAFVDTDALQCGFCTPGMVMSLAAALQRIRPRRSMTLSVRSPGISAAAEPIRTCSRRRSSLAAASRRRNRLMARRVT